MSAIDNPKNVISKHKQTAKNLIGTLTDKIFKEINVDSTAVSEISGLKNAIKFAIMQNEQVNDNLIKTVKAVIGKILQVNPIEPEKFVNH